MFESSLYTLRGVVGTLGITAPFPEVEEIDEPKELYATTLAVTDAPDIREKGLVITVSLGT